MRETLQALGRGALRRCQPAGAPGLPGAAWLRSGSGGTPGHSTSGTSSRFESPLHHARARAPQCYAPLVMEICGSYCGILTVWLFQKLGNHTFLSMDISSCTWRVVYGGLSVYAYRILVDFLYDCLSFFWTITLFHLCKTVIVSFLTILK